MRLTPETLRASYELLLTTPPFSRWKLPPANEIGFAVSRHKTRFADWRYDGKHHIRASLHKHTQLPTVLRSIAHEMAHIRVYQVYAGAAEHGPEFKNVCKAICKEHPYWDYAEFIL